MIELQNLSFAYEQGGPKVFANLNLQFPQGEFALICGPTGGGKSTLLRALNGLVPFHSSGLLSGQIFIDGQQIAGKLPHEVAHLIGYVNQQPEGAFVSDLVIEELAFGMEQLGFSESQMRQRIAQIAGKLDIIDLLERPLDSLSGGQQQRVAIAAAIVAGQKVLLLDEPTSALDVAAAGQLLLMLKNLAHREGITVILIEHRIERVLDLVDSITYLAGDSTAVQENRSFGFDELLRSMPLVPPIIQLGTRLGWSPLPLNVADAALLYKQRTESTETNTNTTTSASSQAKSAAAVKLSVESLTVAFDNICAVDGLSFELAEGSITALFGPNGSGKSSTLWAIQGHLKHTGTVALADGTQPASLKPLARLSHIAMVPQAAADLLLLNTVGEELRESDSFAQVAPLTTANIFESLLGRIDPNLHPRDLSAGQQLALVLALQLAKGADILLLDEPTRGLDYSAKSALANQLGKLRASGISILLASHDVEFIATVADQVILLQNGHQVGTGSARQLLTSLGEHSPQVWQITKQAMTPSEVQIAI